MGAFDIQVNGYGGVDFNQDDLRPNDLRRACAALARDGVDGEELSLNVKQIAALTNATPRKTVGLL